MRKRSKALIAIAIVLAAIATTKIRFIRTYAGGTALWNASEADFFIHVGCAGVRVSRLRYP